MLNSGHRPLGLVLIVGLFLFPAACTLLDTHAALFTDGSQLEPDLSPDFTPGPDLVSSADQVYHFDREIYPPQSDSGPCPTACINGCADGVCQLDCAKGCTCPPGYTCKVECKGGSCQKSIDCSKAKACVISCDQNACNLPIDCGGASCTIGCFKSSCNGPILCGTGGCKVTCSDKSCQNLIRCEKGPCDILCSDFSCYGNMECAQACACSLSCSYTSCIKIKIKCPPGCNYLWSDGCTDSTKKPGCNKC